MKNRIIFFGITATLLSGSIALANDEYDRAKDLAKSGQWQQARDMAEEATKKEPKEAKNWYLLGVTEQRLEHQKAAADAFQKVLELEPSGSLSRAVSVTLPDLKSKGDAEQKYKYGPDSFGLFFAYTPTAGIAAASQLGSNLNTTFEGGLRFTKLEIGFKYGSGDLGKVYVPAEGSASGAAIQPPVNYLANTSGGTYTFKEIYLNMLLPLVDPYTSLGGLQLNLPLYLGGFEGTVNLNKGLSTAANNGTTFGNIGWDFATGLHASYFTKSPIVIDFAALYHFGFPFWDVRQDSNTAGLQGPNNQSVTGGTTGFEAQVGVTFLFGASKPDEF